ncbi:MAG: WbqC family protein [Candidatus Gastranaerophilales bacterium]|nr:WbqC family protein [Candidatus Gastranaerophilales bacterium]
MIKTAIMQPYFFPYLGYYQMFNAVDNFVLLDDVNFIMRGYINRNTILVNGQPHKFSIPLEKPSQNKLINETKLKFEQKERENLLRTFQLAYKKAPFFNDFYPVLDGIVNFEDDDLTSFLKNSFVKVKEYLNLDTEILVSSEIEKDNTLKAQDRIIEINKQLGTNTYINAIGGQELYNRDDFKNVGMELKFIKMLPYEYKQFKNDFVANLSMIDVLMFNSKEEVKKLLDNYELI